MKKESILSLFILLLILFQTITVYADMGPKPSIYVTFENLGDRTVYVSFFALEAGPSPAYRKSYEITTVYGDFLFRCTTN